MAKKQSKFVGYSRRKVNIREIRQRFLIVCEGEETEPNYFQSFRTAKLVIEAKGIGKSPNAVIKKTLELKDKDDYDQCWCVFDRDSWTEEEFTQAIKSAEAEGLQVAYSNQAFELWYILHFEFLTNGLPRSDYQQKLTKLLGHDYKKNSQRMYDELIQKQPTAIKNATKLLKEYDPSNPANDNPSTTVHLLVQELNRFIS